MTSSAPSPRRITFRLGMAAALAAVVAFVPGTARAEDACEVEMVRDVDYYDGPDAHPVKHKLDLYLPKGRKDYPVLLFVHGGAWRHGDKNFMGVYVNFGRYWAKQGVGAVVINYRLSPTVAHPEHIKDVARAFAWTWRNIKKYGGDPDRLLVSGHSAGGHLVSLLATDEKYLRAEGLDLHAIKGVIALSGVYRIPETSGLFEPMFGREAAARKDASPLAHVHPGLPPFLLVYADNDLPYCGKDTSEEFCKALQAKMCPARAVEVKERNHISLLLCAVVPDDPAGDAIRVFIDTCCKR